jgi:hypothetical protein
MSAGRILGPDGLDVLGSVEVAAVIDEHLNELPRAALVFQDLRREPARDVNIAINRAERDARRRVQSAAGRLIAVDKRVARQWSAGAPVVTQHLVVTRTTDVQVSIWAETI